MSAPTDDAVGRLAKLAEFWRGGEEWLARELSADALAGIGRDIEALLARLAERESDAAARIAAQREAASRAWDEAIASRGLTVFDGHATRNRYLDREHPLPARECVLSDGSVVTYHENPKCKGFPWIRTMQGCAHHHHHWFACLNDANTGADLDNLKSFAAGVGR